MNRITLDTHGDPMTIVHVKPGTLIYVDEVGVQLNVSINDAEFGGLPGVSVNTEALASRFTYGDSNGLPKLSIHLNDLAVFDDEGKGDVGDIARLLKRALESGQLRGTDVEQDIIKYLS